MGFSLNSQQIIGNLGQDAEHRFTTTDNCASSFSVATTHGYKDKDGNWKNITTWHNVTAWNQSDFIKNTLKKGAKVYVEGRTEKREYTDKEGVKRYVTEIRANQIIPLDKTENGDDHQQNNSKKNDEEDGW